MTITNGIKVYIAAPFFNANEMAKVQELEKLVATSGYVPLSPRLLSHVTGPGEVPDLTDPEVRADINEANLSALRRCSLVLAWIDRILPKSDQQIALVDNVRTEDGNTWNSARVLKSGLMKPDEGVLWELGYCAAINTPSIIYTEIPEQPVNLMLSENVSGIAVGTEMLTKFLTDSFREVFAWEHLEKVWRGKTI